LTLLLLALIAGCSGDGGSPATDTGTDGSPSAGEGTPLPPAPRAEGTLGKAVVLEHTSVLLSGLQDPYPPDPTFPLAADERLVAFDAEIANVGTEGEFNYSPAFFTAIDNEAEAIYVPSAGLGTTLTAGVVAAGETVSGRIVLLVPATAKIDAVRYKAYEQRDLILINLPE
jgi:hypothetical protein